MAGDRSREEGVPSRFGRGRGMCPLIRLGNCGGGERRRALARRRRRPHESGFPVRNCSIVTALASCFVLGFFFKSLCLFLFVAVPCTSNTRTSQHYLRTNPVVVCVCFTNEEPLLKPVHPVRSDSPGLKQEVFTGFPPSLKQDTSAGPAYQVSTGLNCRLSL